MTPSEIKKYANSLIRWHSRFAVAHAARRATNFLAAGDPLNAGLWRQIEKRIAELQAVEGAERNAAPREPVCRVPGSPAAFG